MIKIRVQLEELVGDMYSHVRDVDITLDDVVLKQIANALGWRNARGVQEHRPTPRAGDGATRVTAKVKSKAKARVKTPRA